MFQQIKKLNIIYYIITHKCDFKTITGCDRLERGGNLAFQLLNYYIRYDKLNHRQTFLPLQALNKHKLKDY